MSLEQVLSLGIKPKSYRILVAKGAIAPMAAYEPVSSRMVYVDTPGITSANPAHFEYRLPSPPPLPVRAGDGLGSFPVISTPSRRPGTDRRSRLARWKKDGSGGFQPPNSRSTRRKGRLEIAPPFS